MKFFVTGSAGLVGRQVTKDLTKRNLKVFSCYNKTKPDYGKPVYLDLSELEKISETVDKIKPEVVIHLAAMTNVDLCETEKELATTINSKATEILAKQAAKQSAFFIYVSTDYVFDGAKEMRKENDPTNPLGFYGRSKLEGEKSIEALASNWCIARTSTPFGFHPTKKSFPMWVLENLREKKEINVLVDQYTSPTYVPNLSEMLIEIANRQILGKIHLAGSSKISRYKMAELVAEKSNLEKKLLRPIFINEMQWKAKRPKDSSLDVSYAMSILENKPQKIEKSIESFFQEL